MLVLSQLMLYYVTIQEAEQKWEAERQLDREGMQKEAYGELQIMLYELKKLLKEKDVQVSDLGVKDQHYLYY